MNTLDVVIFSAIKNQNRELDKALVRLGYSGRFIAPEVWINKAERFHAKPLILVMEPACSQQASILPLLRSAEPKPVLGILPCDPQKWDDELVSCFDDCIGWPCQEEELGLCLDRLFSNSRLAEGGAVDGGMLEEFSAFDLIGRAPTFVAALRIIKNVARYDAPVLIRGETGTGKELCARAIHALGIRRYKPFIPVNCGSIPDNLLENELFGHHPGAYTDAKNAQPGMVELANGGTMFLDEIDSLSAKAQVALLRFTQSQEYRPLGCRSTKQADVRIIAATNADLDEKVASGLFREDLLYRLNVLPVRMPSLRERSGDIGLIAQHILKRYSDQYDQPEKRLSPETLEWMQRYAWPGNVRELENLLHRGLVFSAGPFVKLDSPADNLPAAGITSANRRPESFQDMAFNEAKALAIADFEFSYLQWLMSESKGNVSEAARRAGKERRALGKLIKKYNIDRNHFS